MAEGSRLIVVLFHFNVLMFFSAQPDFPLHPDFHRQALIFINYVGVAGFTGPAEVQYNQQQTVGAVLYDVFEVQHWVFSLSQNKTLWLSYQHTLSCLPFHHQTSPGNSIPILTLFMTVKKLWGFSWWFTKADKNLYFFIVCRWAQLWNTPGV